MNVDRVIIMPYESFIKLKHCTRTECLRYYEDIVEPGCIDTTTMDICMHHKYCLYKPKREFKDSNMSRVRRKRLKEYQEYFNDNTYRVRNRRLGEYQGYFYGEDVWEVSNRVELGRYEFPNKESALRLIDSLCEKYAMKRNYDLVLVIYAPGDCCPTAEETI